MGKVTKSKVITDWKKIEKDHTYNKHSATDGSVLLQTTETQNYHRSWCNEINLRISESFFLCKKKVISEDANVDHCILNEALVIIGDEDWFLNSQASVPVW